MQYGDGLRGALIINDPEDPYKDDYDEEHFINTLKNDVRVVDKVPDFIMERFGYNMSNVHNFKIKAWSSIQYYKDAVLPKLMEEKWVEYAIYLPPLLGRLLSLIADLLNNCLFKFFDLYFS